MVFPTVRPELACPAKLKKAKSDRGKRSGKVNLVSVRTLRQAQGKRKENLKNIYITIIYRA